MLQQLRVKNFRLLRDVQIDFDEVLTVFVGPNSSGKSTVLEVLDFVSRCATDGLERAAAAHGGIESMRTIGLSEPIEIGMRWSFVTQPGAKQERAWLLDWEIALVPTRGGALVVRREKLVDLGDPANPRTLVDTDDNGDRFVYPELADAAPAKVAEKTQLAFDAFVDAVRFRSLGRLKVLLRAIGVVGALPTSPTWARTDVSSPSPRDSLVIGPKHTLERQGLGLANVLYNLKEEHPKAWSELERDFRGEFRFVARITFPAEPAGSKIAFAFEDTRFPGRKLYASEMSDGMVAYLCLLASVYNPGQLAILGLDEPDANLHPSALRRFMAAAQRKDPGRCLAIVTHSNALLDELEDPARCIRVVDSTKDATAIRRLDAAALAAWRKDYSLSDLRRTGLIDASNGSYEAERTDAPTKPAKRAGRGK